MNWLIKLKLIHDVLITTDIEEWINKAVKNKYLNPSMITKVKIDILNFYQVKDRQEFQMKDVDSAADMVAKMEDMTIAIKK